MAKFSLGGLFIYPVKSAGGIALESAVLTPLGLQCDRRWMVVDSQGRFMTQRRFPKMALCHVSVSTPDYLAISAPNMPELRVAMSDESLVGELSSTREVEVWGDRVPALSCGLEANAWWSQFLATPCQLVYMPDTTLRPTDHGKFGTDVPVSFADAYPYLLLSEASLDGLNQKLITRQATPVPMNRFRPNLVISGDCAPHAEDDWKRIRIGSVVFKVAKPCARCSVPNVDQLTGERNQEPSRTLATYRAWDKGIWFGQNLIQENPNPASPEILHVGDEVEVLA